jgi:hypothetical protein
MNHTVIQWAIRVDEPVRGRKEKRGDIMTHFDEEKSRRCREVWRGWSPVHREVTTYPDGSVLTRPWRDAVVDPPRHPESYCHRCGGPNVSWFAPSPLWNAVMRDGSINGDETFDGIVCPTCFAVLAAEQTVASRWRLTAEDVSVPLETVTPSGRAWDDAAQLWQELGPEVTNV